MSTIDEGERLCRVRRIYRRDRNVDGDDYELLKGLADINAAVMYTVGDEIYARCL